MEVYYFKINKLRKIFSSKSLVDETPLQERFRIADHMVEEYCRKCGFDSLGPDEFLIAVKLLLFRYYLNHVSCLYSIIKNNGLKDKKVIIIRHGLRRLYKFNGIWEIVLPGKYSLLGILSTAGIFFKYISSAVGSSLFKDNPAKMTDILVLPAGTGKLEREIWEKISQFLDCSSIVKKFPAKMLNAPYRFLVRNDEIVKKFRADLSEYNRWIPSLLLKLITFQFYNLYQFLILNPFKMVVSFEQSSPYAAVLAYIARLMEKESVDIAHAPTFGENYKYNPSKYSLLFGKSSRESFERKDSIVCGRVIAIGAPKSDIAFQKPIKKKPWNNDVLFLPNYVNRNRDFEQILIFEVIQRFVETFSEIKLTVKPHPAIENPYIQKYLFCYSNVYIIDANSDLSGQVDKHDVTIMLGWSASGLSAVIREKPLIRLNVINIDDWFGYTRSGYALDATNYEELCEAFLSIRAIPGVNSEAKKKLLDYHYVNHGCAAAKIALFLNQSLSENK